MGYFSNGTEGAEYEQRYCSRCIHGADYDGEPLSSCPVLMLHYLWNYEAVGKNGDEIKAAALNTLIPLSDDKMSNEECLMFSRRPDNPVKALETAVMELVDLHRGAEDHLPEEVVDLLRSVGLHDYV